MKTALILSGGGLRGTGHLGLLKVLEENNIKIDCIVGSSIGSFIGASYLAKGFDATYEKFFTSAKFPFRLLDISISMSGLVDGKAFQKDINSFLDNKNFEDLKTKLLINALDLNSEKEIVFKKGNLAKAVRASACLPGLFRPFHTGNMILVDGGTLNAIPINLAKDYDLLIISELSGSKSSFKKDASVIDITRRIMSISSFQKFKENLKNLKGKHILISHPITSGILDFDAKTLKENYDKGIKETQKKIKLIKKLQNTQKTQKTTKL